MGTLTVLCAWGLIFMAPAALLESTGLGRSWRAMLFAQGIRSHQEKRVSRFGLVVGPNGLRWAKILRGRPGLRIFKACDGWAAFDGGRRFVADTEAALMDRLEAGVVGSGGGL